MRYIKLLCLVVLSFLVINIFANPAYAENETPKYKVMVIDQADLLTDYGEKKLAKEMEDLVGYGNVVFYTTKLKKGTNYEKHCEDTYYKLFANQPGVIFQIDMGNRKLTLSASTEMEKLIGSERSSIVDNIYQLATKGKYYECASNCFKQIKVVINDGEIAHDMKYIDNAIIAVVLGLIVNFFLIFTTSRKSNKKEKRKLLGDMVLDTTLAGVAINLGKTSKRYEPRKSSRSGGGGFSGGRGGGGGFSGGSSSHGF